MLQRACFVNIRIVGMSKLCFRHLAKGAEKLVLCVKIGGPPTNIKEYTPKSTPKCAPETHPFNTFGSPREDRYSVH